MSTLSWNCRGLGNPQTVREVVNLVSKKKPEFVFLLDTKVDRSHVERLRVKLGWEGCFCVDSLGLKGDLCLLWAKNNIARLISFSRNHIDLVVTLPNRHHWRLTCYYGYPENTRRRDAWNFLKSLKGASNLPWVVLGDFNDLLTQADKRGHLPHPNGLIDGFREALAVCILSTMPMLGYPFTWEGGRGTVDWVEERLDRVVTDVEWLAGNDKARLYNIQTLNSNHSALFLDIYSTHGAVQLRSFRFENAWLLDDGCREVVVGEWTHSAGQHLQYRHVSCGRGLKRWGANIFISMAPGSKP
ncbi:PREDICTED: uncharacterized protein LOC109152119 [Ipomoea nil]|uniref:uncharacterized protein LOC109152119 n=1 Tax=Ipomoea nil TaxID=35883 RepID=UPI0009012AC2|nr:PREDICTED: uncharacterized protein LOC109152119 [Ipomoea nil]